MLAWSSAAHGLGLRLSPKISVPSVPCLRHFMLCQSDRQERGIRPAPHLARCMPRASDFDFFSGLELGAHLAPTEAPAGLEFATFAGGSFWGLQLAYQRVHGVIASVVGYTQDHVFAVQVLYDPEVVSYGGLIDELFLHIDPTTVNEQRDDVGRLYRSGIYYHSEEQKQIAGEKLKQLQEQIDAGEFRETLEKTVVVELKPAADFFMAEEIHQQFLEKGGKYGLPQSAEKGCKDPIKWFV